MLAVLVRGSNDVASAVAHRLYEVGHSVLIHDGPQPTATRRKMAFADAVLEGRATLAGVTAVRVDDPEAIVEAMRSRKFIPVVTFEFSRLLASLPVDVLVDARMRKRVRPEPQRGQAKLTIGLGPNFVAGETVDLAVETGWGDDLGRVYERGETRPLAGEPKEIGGYARDRYVYAPVEGIFRTGLEIGSPVKAGQAVARVGSADLAAPIDGLLRGLTHDGVPVAAGTKVIEVDPRGEEAVFTGIGERPGRIAEGVLRAVQAWERQLMPG